MVYHGPDFPLQISLIQLNSTLTWMTAKCAERDRLIRAYRAYLSDHLRSVQVLRDRIAVMPKKTLRVYEPGRTSAKDGRTGQTRTGRAHCRTRLRLTGQRGGQRFVEIRSGGNVSPAEQWLCGHCLTGLRLYWRAVSERGDPERSLLAPVSAPAF